MADTDHILLMTTPAEIAFVPALIEKRAPAGKGEPRWELALLLDANHPDLLTAKEICKRVAEKQSPGITASPTAWKYPWSMADAYIARGKAAGKTYDTSHMAGKVLLNTHATKYEPKLSVLMNGKVVDFWDEAARQTIKDKFYMGCQVLCEIAFVWYPAGNGLPGVTAYLNKVCSLNRGEKRGGGGKSGAETFGAHVGHLSNVDPTAATAEVDY